MSAHTTLPSKPTRSILSEPENKYDFYNFSFNCVKNFGNTQMRAFWLPTDVSHENDNKTFQTVPRPVKKMLEMTLGFFASADGIVLQNIDINFMAEFMLPEVRRTYLAIALIEAIHAESYGNQLQAICGNDPHKLERLMKSIETIPAIQKMARWAEKYMDSTKYSLLDRLTAFLCVEGIFFSSPFAFIFWVRKYCPGKVEGIVAANDLISRDENLHCEFAIHLINLLQSEGHKSTAQEEIFRSAIEVTSDFVNDTLTEDFLDMNASLMISHVKSVANRWAMMIGMKELYPDCMETPFDFMTQISLQKKDNFFEKNPTSYQKAPSMTFDVVSNDTTIENVEF